MFFAHRISKDTIREFRKMTSGKGWNTPKIGGKTHVYSFADRGRQDATVEILRLADGGFAIVSIEGESS